MKLRTLFALSTITVALGTPATTAAQQDPTAAGGGKKPFVLVVMDSSASMEWTDDGDDEYPMVSVDDDGTPDFIPVDGSDVFAPGKPMKIEEANPSTGPVGFGPCMMWEPTTEDHCGGDRADDEYHRPAWKPKTPGGWGMSNPTDRWQAWNPNDPFGRPIERRFWSLMRGTSVGINGVTRWRLTPHAQPRHVTIKEVMTGDMVLLPTDLANGDSVLNYDPDEFGPGCWFVPRQRDATAQQDPHDRLYCNGEDEFEDFPDHDQPLPHFQEVYDGQLGNGVMDKLSGSAIFAVAAFDGYRNEVRDPEFNAHWHPDHLDDDIDGSAPGDPGNSTRDASTFEGASNCNGTSEDCYDLGVWRIVTPTDLEIPSTLLPELSAFTQIALKDVGFLTRDDDNDFELSPDKNHSEDRDYLGATFSKDFKHYIDKFQLGKHPIARATPIAAAMHDVYQFFSHGQDGKNPIHDDAFAECRPKHVILLTDGKPEPERFDPTTLNEAFGYDENLYTYDTSEQEIMNMVNDMDDTVPPAGPGFDPDYGVRVHVVGLNIGSGDGDAIGKLANMAIEGKTCAEVLVPSLIPDTHGGPCDTSDPTTGCLVDQAPYMGGGYTYTEPNTGDPISCDNFPALILDNNDSDILSSGLFEMFSGVIQSAGLASRTKAVVADRLDDISLPSGGQYRIFSGVKVGGNPWWKGVLNRVTRKCDTTGPQPDALSLDDEVAEQILIDSGGDVSDNRRIFTSVPHDDIYNYSSYEPENLGNQYSIPNTMFPMVYWLGKTSNEDSYDDDTFQETYLFADDDPYLGTRVPFEDSALHGAYENPVTSPQNRDYWEFFNVGSSGEMPNLINVYRGRIPERAAAAQGGTAAEGRAIGGILNSNPVVVGPPNLDLPIGSYREYRARFADRPTMLYVASMDGLLHAIHTGRLEERVLNRLMTPENTEPAPDAKGDAATQREAWAYLPQMLHREIAGNLVSQPYLLDGSPVVKDVRLCDQDPDKNTSPQACPCPSGVCGDNYPAAMQWRSVLVQGRGLAGSGYFALDVTRPGGVVTSGGGAFNLKNPDPVVLWEFDREWEQAQVDYLLGEDPGRVADFGVDSSLYSSCGDEGDFWESAFMGLSTSEPAIGTVLIDHPEGGKAQRPVAVFGAGVKRSDVTGCGANANGMAIYVIDLQTGSLLRRFVTYQHDGNTHYFLDPHDPDSGQNPGPAAVSGTPALFDGSTGAITTRGFIGDGAGRMFRIDMLDPDPSNWTVDLFFDPNDEGANADLATLYSNAGFNNESYGPADYKPAVTVSPSRQVHVVYGLGEVGDTVSNDQVQAVLAVREKIDTSGVTGELIWAEVFEEGEKLTGSPIIFDAAAYFPTYRLPAADVCEPGTARIWGLRVPDPDDSNLVTHGIFQNNATIVASPMGLNVGPNDPDEGIKWFGPEDPTLIRGLTITLGESCAAGNIGRDDMTFDPNDRPQPQLIAQTSGDVDTTLKNTDNPGGDAANTVDRLVLDIPDPSSETIPLNWSIISN